MKLQPMTINLLSVLAEQGIMRITRDKDRMWEENLGDKCPKSSHKEAFKEWCNYGSFTGKVKRFTISC